MTCQEFLARHAEYLDELLSSRENERWEAHIDECASCARYDRVVRQGIDLVRNSPEIVPSSDFFPRLQHRLYHLEDEMSGLTRGPGASAVVSLAIAGVLALLAWSPLMRLDHVLLPLSGSDDLTAEFSEPAAPESSLNAMEMPRPLQLPSSITPLEIAEPDWSRLQLVPREGRGSSLVSDEFGQLWDRHQERLGGRLDPHPPHPWLADPFSGSYLTPFMGESMSRSASVTRVRPAVDTLLPGN